MTDEAGNDDWRDGWEDEGQAERPLADLFPGFASKTVSTSGARIFARVGGEGPPLVCLHGFPQTHVMWHRIAPALAERFTLVLMDLRGYGWSSAPESGPPHTTYSKRAMGKDVVEVMSHLGHARFSCLAHDRGARVAYRLGLDDPGRLERLVLLDILPTLAMWERIETDAGFAQRASHWRTLAEPASTPEDAILADSEAFLEATLARWSAGAGMAGFSPDALEHYRRPIDVPDRVHAFCEDYRAGATLDRMHDRADLDAGRTIRSPVHIVWGARGFPAGGASPLDAWRPFGPDVTGEAIDAGHFLAEEAPEATLAAIERGLGVSR